MEKLLYNVSQVLGTTLIHSLWQGLLIYAALQLIFLAVLGLSAQRKHNLGMLALFAMVGWFAYTFYAEFNAYDWNPEVTNYRLSDNISLALYNTYVAHAPTTHNTWASYKADFFNALKVYMPYIACLYAIGLVINLGRLGIAWNRIRTIKKELIGNLALQKRVNELSRTLGLRKPVQLSFTPRIDGPCVISFVKPLLLLPVSITTQLSADEVEAILIHELSHIQSNDYLLNLLQQLITVLLFFNPFAILISRIVSSERENRCDDIVVQTTGDPLIYAQALLKLEETRQTNLTLALAATGKKYHLLTRIERIMKSKKPVGNFKHLLLAMVVLAGSLGSISWLNPEIKDGKIVLKRTAAKVLPATIDAPALTANTAKIPAPAKPKNHITIIAADTTPLSQLIDTAKKVKKNTIKIVLEDENGNKKEYTSLKDLPADVRKEFLQENGNRNFSRSFSYNFNTDSMRLGDLARNLNFKSNGDLVYKSDDLKNLKFNSDFKVFNETELKKLREMNAEFKKLNAEKLDKMRKMAKEMNAKELDKMRKISKELNAKELERMKTLRKNSADLQKMYSSPEWKKNIADITKASTDFAKKFTNSEDWQKSMQELTKQSTKFSQDFINSPEWKKYQEDLMKQVDELSKMQNESSKEARDRAKEISNKIRMRTMELRDQMQHERQERIEKAERPEKPEKPEQPEKKEKAEKPELPEQPGKP